MHLAKACRHKARLQQHQSANVQNRSWHQLRMHCPVLWSSWTWVVGSILQVSKPIYPAIQADKYIYIYIYIYGPKFLQPCLAHLEMNIQAEQSIRAGLSWQIAVSRHECSSYRILWIFVKSECHVFLESWPHMEPLVKLAYGKWPHIEPLLINAL